MNNRLAWLLAALLLASCAWNVRALLVSGPGLATMPIFVPVSLEYERQMRTARGQPAGRGGEEAAALARALVEEPDLDPALAPQVEALRATRERLLDARGRRHALNVALMDVGVAVVSELTPEQWAAIHMQRDSLRARTEAEVFDRLREKLR
ncbi:MAG: hypothetical protein Q8P41_16425 [Pseudomonadota bacterium]|nr:hypothetical protein [Pseudomonadota bacterium]